jgi:hypothetical protein
MTGPEHFIRVPKTDVCEDVFWQWSTLVGKFSLFALESTYSCGEGFVIAAVFIGIAALASATSRALLSLSFVT